MDYFGKLLRVMETLELHLHNGTDPAETEYGKADGDARERVRKEIYPLLTEAQQKIVNQALSATESLYEYLMLRGKSLGFALAIVLGTEAVCAIDEFFCWD